MAPIMISIFAFVLALIGVLLGSLVQKILPEGHLNSDSKEVVKLSMGVVATLWLASFGWDATTNR